MSWASKFVGIPQRDHGRDRDGVDCWGLICVAYQEELNISLPHYLGYSSPDESQEVAALIDQGKRSPLWLPVGGPALAFDVALFRMGRLSTHVGLVVKTGFMVHVAGGSQTCVERYTQGVWANRLKGHYRHVQRAVEHPVATPTPRQVQIISQASQ